MRIEGLLSGFGEGSFFVGKASFACLPHESFADWAAVAVGGGKIFQARECPRGGGRGVSSAKALQKASQWTRNRNPPAGVACHAEDRVPVPRSLGRFLECRVTFEAQASSISCRGDDVGGEGSVVVHTVAELRDPLRGVASISLGVLPRTVKIVTRSTLRSAPSRPNLTR